MSSGGPLGLQLERLSSALGGGRGAASVGDRALGATPRALEPVSDLLNAYVRDKAASLTSDDAAIELPAAGPLVDVPAPIAQEVHAAIADEALRQLVEADAQAEQSHRKLVETLRSSDPHDSDAVKIARMTTELEQEKSARQHAQALRKIASDERVASLGLELKRLEGENAIALTTVNNANARAAALEAAAAKMEAAKDDAEAALRLEREKAQGAVAVEGKKGWSTIIVAIVGVVGTGLGALGGAVAKGKAEAAGTGSAAAPGNGSGSGHPAVAPPQKNEDRCVLRILGIKGLDHPEKVALRLRLSSLSSASPWTSEVPKLAAWFKASEAAALGTMDLPSCSGEALVTVFVGDAYQGTLSQNGESFQETLVFDQRAPGKFDLLSKLSSTDKDAILEYVVEKR